VNTASCAKIPVEAALSVPDICTAVCVADAVKVLTNVVTLLSSVCVMVVATARSNPPVVISPGSSVSPASAPVVSTVSAIKLAPLVPADVFVYTCAWKKSLPSVVNRLCWSLHNICSSGLPTFLIIVTYPLISDYLVLLVIRQCLLYVLRS